MDSIQCIEGSSVIMSTSSSNNTTEKHVVVFNINDVSRQQFLQKKRRSSLKSTGTRNSSNVSTTDEMKKKSIGNDIRSVDDLVESSNDNNKSVRFSIVEIRDYNLCLGDNPSVSRGVPISLDWDYDTEHSHEFEVYESDRIIDRRTDHNEMKRPSLQRVQLLKGLGYSRGEINEQTKSVHLIKQQRLKTRRRVERNEHMQFFFNRVVHCFSSNKKKVHHVSSTSSTPTSSTGSNISLKRARKRLFFLQRNDSMKSVPHHRHYHQRHTSGDDEDETLASSTSSTKSGMITATEIDL